ncbi:hypothetical protein BCR33DRAFT_713942 [Rhizoclosmatium globosum]|uniref:Uncharacterized protein n=1 Tax=Rhizoclosmatium globosum TaxID=329046 RepID=A0A1Y2CRG6_9FUNG|nr:hypothetical protein BCR33DRAFT_713942 [Rhizoclosmatium globosum]|eukprot:ORY49619.1 hypothetical protein BCR33DRAFT_713942 [Rhizoclosmatium globosum]
MNVDGHPNEKTGDGVKPAKKLIEEVEEPKKKRKAEDEEEDASEEKAEKKKKVCPHFIVHCSRILTVYFFTEEEQD